MDQPKLTMARRIRLYTGNYEYSLGLPDGRIKWVDSHDGLTRAERNTKPTVKCPECGAHMRKSNLAKHLRRVHPGSPEPQLGPRHSMIPCPQCGASVRASNLSRHQRQVHGINARTDDQPQRQPSTNPMTTCPACGVAVRQSRLTNHLQRVHPGNPEPQLGPDTNCPECGIPISISEVADHLHTAHRSPGTESPDLSANIARLQNRLRPDPQTNDAPSQTTCPHCGLTIRIDQLWRHIQEDH